MKCLVCERELDESRFRGKSDTCLSCCAGRRRFRTLRASRPFWFDLDARAVRCLLQWEIGRLALTRALFARGVVVEWRGYTPMILERGPFSRPSSFAERYLRPCRPHVRSQ